MNIDPANHHRGFPKYLRFVFPVLAIMVLAACGERLLRTETCEQQTRNFTNTVLSIVQDELNPLIEQGLKAGPATQDVINQLEELDTKVSKLNAPSCNPKTKEAKDALRSYMLEVRNYFNIAAGLEVYGEGARQAQLGKIYDTSLTFEAALDELPK